MKFYGKFGKSYFFIQKNTSRISFFKKTFYTLSDNDTHPFFDPCTLALPESAQNTNLLHTD